MILLVSAVAKLRDPGDTGAVFVMLELPKQDFPASARSLPLRIIDIAERIEITTDNLDATLRTLIDAHVPLNNLRIRPANLEDLFLELTGKELRT